MIREKRSNGIFLSKTITNQCTIQYVEFEIFFITGISVKENFKLKYFLYKLKILEATYLFNLESI